MTRIPVTGLILLSLSTACFAQAGGSDRQGGQGQPGPAAKAPQPATPGAVKPCGQDKSATSDRGGGNEKKSGSSTNNPGGAVKSGDC